MAHREQISIRHVGCAANSRPSISAPDVKFPSKDVTSHLPPYDLTFTSCSVACATLHRAIPCEVTVARSLTPPAHEPEAHGGSTRPLPGTVGAAASGSIFSVLENSQKLQALFVMYPHLRSQLREIYRTTLPPTNDYLACGLGHDASYQQVQRGRGGGRGVISRAGSTKQQGPWNSDRGTQEGIDALSRAKLEFGKGGEGVREYANLVLKLVAADGVDVAQLVQDEVAEENAKIIAQLLNGDPY